MLSKRRRRIVAGAAFVILAVLLCPLPAHDIHKGKVIANAIRAFQEQERVLLDWQYIPFYDSGLIGAEKRTWHCDNRTAIPTNDLEILGVRPCPEELLGKRMPFGWFSKGNVLIEITYKDVSELTDEPHLRLNCYHGPLGGQGYRVRIYRCLLGVFAYFTCEWVS